MSMISLLPVFRRMMANGLVAGSMVCCLPALTDDNHSKKSDSPSALPSIAPTEISSDSMDYDVANHLAVFTGNVVVVDARMTLHADQMTIYFDQNDQLKHLEASGNVKITSENNVATGGKAEYDAAAGNLVLTGNPILRQGLNQIVGAEKIVYSRTERKFRTVDGRPTIRYYHDGGDKTFMNILQDDKEKADRD